MGSLVLLQKGLGLEIVQTNHPPIVEICAIFCNNSFKIVRNISLLLASKTALIPLTETFYFI